MWEFERENIKKRDNFDGSLLKIFCRKIEIHDAYKIRIIAIVPNLEAGRAYEPKP